MDRAPGSDRRTTVRVGERPRYGFVGLGRLGGLLACSLLRGGLELTVTDLDRTAGAPQLELGAAWADTPAAVAAASDAVITCLPSPAASEQVLLGADGLLGRLHPGSTWIETSTLSRDEILRLAAASEARGVRVLEAPVTGGVHLAASGEITVLVGGDEALVREHRPALETIGGRVHHLGPLGSASVVKVITNMLAFVHLVAVGEALMLARQAGIDLGAAYEAIRDSSGTSFVHETESQVILSGSYDIGFTLDLACKDLGFATELGRELDVPLDLASATATAFERARELYGGDAWSPRVVQLLEDAVGVELRADGFPERL